ncbi:alpha/beta fold hydrolase [Legionella gresilensis]|uniref:alpha/beta fold hydrolase n=1 Tax=Legionella gresilensis TaxID=91823 RepID=UPI0010416558|nr:alpha/beta hydrolase [Legionella gresilensis]
MDELKLNIPGFTIAARTWGNNELPPLLAIHGWLDNADSFELLAPYLAKDFYVIAIDLPGHGLSSHLYEGGYYHFIDGVFTLINIIDALHIKKIHLLGHSLGACLASILAGIAPTRISTVALIEGLGPLSRPEDTCREQLSSYLFKSIEKKHSKPKFYSSIELAAKARAARGFLSLELVRLLCARGLSESHGKFYWHHDRRLVYPSPLSLTEAQIISCLSGITSPTCLILTEHGSLFNEDDIQHRIAAVKNLKIMKVSGGHHLHMENPSVVAQHLDNFYRSV